MSTNQNHPLPAPPGQHQQRPAGRERANSKFSFHSRKSSGSGNKIDLHETHEEKQQKRLKTHADPSLAMQEAEPSAVASDVKSSLAPIRAIQHRDHLGNPISDPDRSNPTRSRWERPLDTIRSFEAAIDGNYSRKSYIRTESDGASNMNRRSSYYAGTEVTTAERPNFQNSYYGGRTSSYADGRSSYYGGGARENAGPSNGYYPNRARYPRTASEPQFNNGGVYPTTGNQQSYETVTTASGSGSSDPAGYGTDPSSMNSSMDQITSPPVPTKDPGEAYGFSGFGGDPQYAPPGAGLQENYGSQRAGNGPTVLRKESSGPRVPIKLGQASGNAGPPTAGADRPAPAEKRKSWLGRRFSRAG